MKGPFFDTSNVARLRIAANLVTYPHQFCLRESNRLLLIGLEPTDQGMVQLVHSLSQIQERLSPLLPLAGGRHIWAKRSRYLEQLGVETALAVPAGSAEMSLRSTLDELLNTRILEGVLDQIPQTSDGIPEMHALQLAAASSWLSDHLALIVLGVAAARVDPTTGSVMVGPAGDCARRHLRRMWFGNAFEQLSLKAASATLQTVAYVAANPSSYHGDRQQLFYQALAVFPQHWRLPADSGPVADLLHEYLVPLIKILINISAAHAFSQPPMPYLQEKAAELGAGAVFELVRDMQASAPLTDRLFEVVDDGLVLGGRALAPGAISVAEHLAHKILGKDWHAKVSSYQKSYVLERLSRCAHLTVLDFELRQHDTSHNVALDVDFMVREETHGVIYAVQLKHFETSDKSGLLSWISRFRERDKALGKAVQQLENLRNLLVTDERIRVKLDANGISPSTFDRIVPVVLHNVGPLDFWELQSGVFLYDIGTFCNVLAGRSATFVGAAGGQIFTGARDGRPQSSPSLHDPESVIAAYLADRDFADLKSFDLADRAVRTLAIDGKLIVIQGLGI